MPHVLLYYGWKDRSIWATNQIETMLLELREKEPFWIVLRGASIQNEEQPGQPQMRRVWQSSLENQGSNSLLSHDVWLQVVCVCVCVCVCVRERERECVCVCV